MCCTCTGRLDIAEKINSEFEDIAIVIYLKRET